MKKYHYFQYICNNTNLPITTSFSLPTNEHNEVTIHLKQSVLVKIFQMLMHGKACIDTSSVITMNAHVKVLISLRHLVIKKFHQLLVLVANKVK